MLAISNSLAQTTCLKLASSYLGKLSILFFCRLSPNCSVKSSRIVSEINTILGAGLIVKKSQINHENVLEAMIYLDEEIDDRNLF